MAKTKQKKKVKKVKRDSKGHILKGSGSNGGGRPKGAKSTGKKPVKKIQSSSNPKNRKPGSSSNKSIKSASKRHTSTSKRKKPQEGVIRNKQGQVQKGSAGIGGGRKAGTSRVDELNRAIAEVEREKGDGQGEWLKDLIRRSYIDTTLAVAILSRKFPVLKAIELHQTQHTDEDRAAAAEIRKKIRERFKPAKTIAELEAEIEKIKQRQQAQQNETVRNR